MSSGAEVHGDVSVTGVSRDASGRVNGAFGRLGDGTGAWFRADHVVGADGVRSRIARSVGAPILEQRPPTNAVVYSYFPDLATAGYDFRFIDHRNLGLIPTNGGLTLAFVAGPISEAPRDSETYLMETLCRTAPDLAQAVGAATRVERLRRTSGIPSFIRQPTGPGWSLVGDAGLTVDPITAHGIGDALRDAELCAGAVDSTLRNPESEADAAEGYRRSREVFARPIFDAAARLSTFAWEPAEASELLRRIGDVIEDECRFLSERTPLPLPAA